MKLKAMIMDEAALLRALMRISHEIIEKNRGCKDICLIGIRRRGVPVAQMLAAKMKQVEGTEIPVGVLDITLYRDDLTTLSDTPVLNDTSVPFNIVGKKVILVDDVLFTGRTVRAAIDAVFALGRPASVQLAILIDRGHRELPFRADFVGKSIPTSSNEIVKVRFKEFDGETGVSLYEID